MAKFDRINDKRKAEISIKQSKEKEKEYVPHAEQTDTFLHNALAIKNEENPEPVHPSLGDNTIADSTVYLRSGGGALSLSLGKMIDSFYRETPTENLERKLEVKTSMIHEELSKREKENKDLKALVIKLLNSQKKDKKRLEDLREEFHETLIKHGDSFDFIKNYILQMRKENRNQNSQ